jgi:hypothetical protein
MRIVEMIVKVAILDSTDADPRKILEHACGNRPEFSHIAVTTVGRRHVPVPDPRSDAELSEWKDLAERAIA